MPESQFSTTPTTHWRAYLLGTLRIEQDHTPMVLPTSLKARELLAYLLLQRGLIQPRALLAGLLWPELSEARAHRALNTALWRIRRSLPGLIETTAGGLLISTGPELWIDVEAFHTAVQTGLSSTIGRSMAIATLRAAITGYPNTLLTGYYAEWLPPLRAHYTQLYQRALTRLSQVEKERGNYKAALQITQQLAQLEPLDESLQREIMRLDLALGQPQAALQQFERYRLLVRDELGLDPEPATWELVQAAATIAQRAGEVIDSHIPTLTGRQGNSFLETGRLSALPLIGRERERERLLEYVETLLQAPERGGGVILIEGEAGVGKTRLLQEIARDAAWRGVEVLWSRNETTGPFAILIALIRSGLTPLRAEQLAQVVAPIWLQVLGQLIPELHTWLPQLGTPPAVDHEQAGPRLLEAQVQLLRGWSQLHPLVLLLEDLHKIDSDSLAVEPEVAQRLRNAPILIIGSYRGAEARARSEVWQALQTLDRQVVRERLELRRLDVHETAALTRWVLGNNFPAERFEARVHWETQGNPLFVLHLLHWLYETGMLYRNPAGEWATPYDETTSDYAELQVPPLIAHHLTRRLERLTPPAYQVVAALAVLGETGSLTTLSALLAIAPLELLPILQGLEQSEFVIQTARGYGLSHAQLTEVTYNQLPEVTRQTLHRKAAQILSQAQEKSVAATVARHWLQAGEWAAAAANAFQAGETARALYAGETAINWYRQALTALEQLPPEQQDHRLRIQIHQAWGAVLLFTDHYPEAFAQLMIALSLAEATLDKASLDDTGAHLLGQVYTALAEVADRRGDYVQMMAEVDRGLRALQGIAPTVEIAQLYYWSGWAELHLGEHIQATAKLTRALTLAETLPAPHLAADCQRALGVVARWQGDHIEARSHYEEAIARYYQLGDQAGASKGLHNLGILMWHMGNYAEARLHFSHALEEYRASGHQYMEGHTLNLLGSVSYMQGNYMETRRYYEESLALLKKLGDRQGEALTLMGLGQLYARQGDYPTAIALNTQALQLFQAIADRSNECGTWANLSLCYAFQGENERVAQCNEAALHLARDLADSAMVGHILISLGRSWLIQNAVGPAEQAFIEALNIRRTLGVQSMVIEALAGVAAAHLARGARAAALTAVEEILTCPTTHSWEQTEDPFWIYQVCYQVLETLQDPRAEKVMKDAYQRLNALAAQFTDPAVQQSFLNNIPAHRELVTAYTQHQARRQMGQQTVQLPAITAPLRGQLRAEQYVPVTWTVKAPEDQRIANKVTRRQQQLQRLLAEAAAQGAAPTVHDLAAAVNSSWRTVLRDLETLRRTGDPCATRGKRDSL